MLMKKDFLPYQQSFDMKWLGFDEPCFGFYDMLDYNTIVIGFRDNKNSALTFSQAFRWFREKYQLHSTITSISQESWQWHIQKPGQQLGKLYDEDFYTYEEAELECLVKLIEIVKTK